MASGTNRLAALVNVKNEGTDRLKNLIENTPKITADEAGYKSLTTPTLKKQAEPFSVPWYRSPGLKEQVDALAKYNAMRKVLSDPMQASKLKAAEMGYSLSAAPEQANANAQYLEQQKRELSAMTERRAQLFDIISGMVPLTEEEFAERARLNEEYKRINEEINRKTELLHSYGVIDTGERIGGAISSGIKTGAAGIGNTLLKLSELKSEAPAKLGTSIFTALGGDKEAAKRVAQQRKAAYDTASGLLERLDTSGQEDLELATRGTGGAGKFALEGVATLANMGTAAAISPLVGGFAPAIGIQAGGSAALQAGKQGKSETQQLLYGLGTGVSSGLTEALGGIGGSVLTKGLASKAAQALLSKLPEPILRWATTTGAKIAGGIISNMASEAFEEELDYNVDRFLQKLILNNDVPFDVKQMSGQMLIGGAIGGLVGGGAQTIRILSALSNSAKPEVAQRAAEIQSRITSGDPSVAQRAQNDAVAFLHDVSKMEDVVRDLEAALSAQQPKPETVAQADILDRRRRIQQRDYAKAREMLSRMEAENQAIALASEYLTSDTVREMERLGAFQPEIADLKKAYNKAFQIQQRINWLTQNNGKQSEITAAQRALTEAAAQLTAAQNRIANYLKGVGKPTAVSPFTPARAQERVQATPDGLGAARAGFDATGRKIQRMISDYGAIKPGETPITQERVVELPKQTSPGKNVMQTVRTIMEAPVVTNVTAETVEKLVADEKFSREAVTDKGAAERAKNTIKSKGYRAALDDFSKQMAKGRATKDSVALGFTLLSASEAVGDTKTSVDIITDIANNVRNAAQIVQAVRMLKKMQPEYQLYALARSVESFRQELIGKYGDRAPDLTIDDALAQEYYDALAAKDDARAEKAMDAVYRHIAEQVPASFADKWNAWRYTAMLFNPVTHIKNILGNYVFRAERSVKNVLSASMQTAAKNLGADFEPTRAILTKKDAPLILESESYYNEDVDAILRYGKYDDATNKINEYRKIFGQGGKTAVGDFLSKTVGRTVEKGRNLNTKLLETEDKWVSKPAYIKTLASYLKANGKTFQTADEGLLTRARAFAILEAQKAAYRDSNAFSDFVANLRYKGKSRAGKAVNVVGEGILPYRRTPANMLLRGLEYSPLGLAKTATVDVTKMLISRKLPGLAEKLRIGDISTAEFFDNLSEGLTGTALTGLGMLLAAWGVITVGTTGDEKKDKFEQTQGKQDFALNIGKYSYTIDWIGPSAMPLFMGVSIYNKLTDKRDSGVTLDDALKIASDISEPLLETSMLQSLNDWFEGFGYAKAHDENMIWYGLSQGAMNYLGQAVPTIGGRINRTIDKTRRTVYTDPQSGIPTDFQYFFGSQLNKVPGGSFANQPYVDQWGRTQETGFAERLFQNWASPGYLKKITETPMEKELQRLYDEYAKEADISVLPPPTIKKYFSNDGEEVHMTADEYTQYKITLGRYAFSELTKLTGSDAYKNMTEEDKAKAVNDVWKAAAELAKTEVVEGRGEMRIPTKDDAKKLQKYIDAGVPQDKAYELYKALDALQPERGADRVTDYQRISLISKQDLTAQQKVALAAGLYATKSSESLLPYLRYAKHLLDLYVESKDSIFVSMTVPDKVTQKDVEYELTDEEKETFKKEYLRIINSKDLSFYGAGKDSVKAFSRLRDDAYQAAKNAVLRGRR